MSRKWLPGLGCWAAEESASPVTKKPAARIRIMSDDDGHDYFVPVGKEKAFREWLAAGPYWENYKGEEFESIDSALSCFTFENPQEML